MITFLHHNRTKVNYKFKQRKQKIIKKKDGSSKSVGKLCGSVKKTTRCSSLSIVSIISKNCNAFFCESFQPRSLWQVIL